MPATPQDHKKPDAPFTFTVAGKKHTLPKLSESAGATIPGDVTFDAIMEPDNEMAQMRLALATLIAAKPKPEALTALKSLPTNEMLEKIGAWLGESSGSSD